MLVWAFGLIVGFGLLLYGLHSVDSASSAVYFSSSTFFTLGLGDVVPKANASRAVVLLEAATGLGFLAMMISYLPIFYQAFSRR
ncbi:MAG TPA: potassium channel family protein, partial [Dehalococcoidia bacterium]|nr:potassium channel family protein [Dehalococcoidia bacterium]